MSDLRNSPAHRIVLGLFVLWILYAMWFYGWFCPTMDLSRCRSNYSSLFKTPIDSVKLSDCWANHGHTNFLVSPISGSLALQEDRGFKSLEYQNTPFLPHDKPWITRCYYQCHDDFLTGCNDDVWIYADSMFSKAFVVTDDHQYEHIPVSVSIKPVFVKIFRTPFDHVNFIDSYERGKNTYFEIISPTAGAPIAPKIVLQDSLSFQKIDPNPIIYGDKFPPRQKGETWMTSCFYHVPSGSPNDDYEVWVFFNNAMSQAFVIANHQN